MSRKSNRTATESPPAPQSSVKERLWPAPLVGPLTDAEALLAGGRVLEAVTLLARVPRSPWVQNAIGVCQLRLGEAALAMEIFGPLVLASNGVVINKETPTVFRANYATSLFAAGNLAGCLWAFKECGADPHPVLASLRESLRLWKSRLTIWQRFQWAMGGEPAVAVELVGTMGALE